MDWCHLLPSPDLRDPMHLTIPSEIHKWWRLNFENYKSCALRTCPQHVIGLELWKSLILKKRIVILARSSYRKQKCVSIFSKRFVCWLSLRRRLILSLWRFDNGLVPDMFTYAILMSISWYTFSQESVDFGKKSPSLQQAGIMDSVSYIESMNCFSAAMCMRVWESSQICLVRFRKSTHVIEFFLSSCTLNFSLCCRLWQRIT